MVFGGSNRALTPARVEELLDAALSGDVVVLQNEVSGMAEILSGCVSRGLSVVLNPAPMSDDLVGLDLSPVRWLIVNEVEVKQLVGSDDVDAAWAEVHRRWPNASLVITLGEEGSVCFHEGQKVVQPAFAVDAVDTTAAGDTFIGYFVASIEDGLPLEDCLRRASLASAIAVTRPGAAPSIPWKHEVANEGASCL